MHDQAALVAVLRRRDAGDDLHRLDRVGRELIRIDAALLVGDRLVVDRELRLRVIPDRMKEPVRIGDDPGRSHRDDLVQPERRRLEREFGDEALIDVGVRRGIAFDEILGVSDHLHGFGCSRDLQRDGQVDGNRATYVHVGFVRRKALRRRRDVIRVRRQIAEREPAVRVGRRAALESRDRVAEIDRDRSHRRARRIFNRSLDRASAAQFLGARVGDTHDGNSSDQGRRRKSRLPEPTRRHHEASFQNNNEADGSKRTTGERPEPHEWLPGPGDCADIVDEWQPWIIRKAKGRP